jgi:hypothetical protein
VTLFCAAFGVQAQYAIIPVGQSSSTSSALALVISGNHAYTSHYVDGLAIYDISNPQAPVEIGHTNYVPQGQASVSGVAVTGNYAYVANADDGLRVYDISDPAHPQNIGHTNDSTALRAYASGVVVFGNYVYLANGTDGMRIYDVSNTAQPSNVGHISVGYGNCITVGAPDNTLYVGANSLGLYDITTHPASPSLIGQASTSGHLAVAGDLVYVSGYLGLDAYRVNDPVHPDHIAHLNGNFGVVAASSSGRFAYLFQYVGTTQFLNMYDFQTAAQPSMVAQVRIPKPTYGLLSIGNYLYAAGAGLQTYAVVPQLRISHSVTNTVIVSWPATVAGFSLQQNASLSVPNWLAVTNAVQTVGDENQVLIQQSAGNGFFRLAGH